MAYSIWGSSQGHPDSSRAVWSKIQFWIHVIDEICIPLHMHLPVFYDERKKIRHRRRPEFSESVIIEATIKGYDVVNMFLGNW